MILRPPLMADALILRSWRPDLDHVPTDDHLLWFAKYAGEIRFNNAVIDLRRYHKMLIAEMIYDTEQVANLPCGMVRFDSSDAQHWEISYIVAPAYRKKGVCIRMLTMALEDLQIPVDHVKAKIQKDNHASIHCALKVGIGVELLK